MRRQTGVSLLSVYLYHLSHVALGACVLSGVFNFNQHYEEQVVPHVVLLLDVLLKRHRLVVKLVPLQTCRGPIQLRCYRRATRKSFAKINVFGLFPKLFSKNKTTLITM